MFYISVSTSRFKIFSTKKKKCSHLTRNDLTLCKASQKAITAEVTTKDMLLRTQEGKAKALLGR